MTNNFSTSVKCGPNNSDLSNLRRIGYIIMKKNCVKNDSDMVEIRES